MTFEEFERFVADESALAESLKKAASTAVAETPAMRKTFDPLSAVALTSALVIVFPVVNRIVRRIGLPWLHSLERYSELWRLEFGRWIDKQYKKRGFDPAASKAASEALLEELQKTTDAEARQSWERLLSLLSKSRDEQDPSAARP